MHNPVVFPVSDAETGEVLHNVIYGWDMRYRPTVSAPYLDGTLGPFATKASETEAGALKIYASEDTSAAGMAQLRCRVVNGTETYTSPFYRFLVTTEDVPTIPAGS